MKKLLLILLCLPMIGFGQDNCGEKPKKPLNKSAKEFKEWRAKYNLWIECKEKANSDTLNKIELPIIEGAENKIYDFKTGKLYKNFNSIPVGTRYIYNKSINIKIAKDGYRFLQSIN